jgi:GABA(A) receptor-associated protein
LRLLLAIFVLLYMSRGMSDFTYKDVKDFVQRSKESMTIKQRFPGRVPIIIERAQRSDVPLIDKNKYLCPDTLTVGQFIYVIRKRLTLPPEKALFVFVKNTLPLASSFLREVYAQYHDIDGFLYMTYASESTFGSHAAGSDEQ